MAINIMDKLEEAAKLLGSTEICKAELIKVRNLADKVEKQRLTISVIGQFKRGKSTLVNAILGSEILPVGIVPVTSVVTAISYGEPSAIVKFENGTEKQVDFEDLHIYVNEQENEGNKLGVSSVTIHALSDFLNSGVMLVDTPGVGSVHKHNTEAAYAFVKESDAVIFMLSIDSPINEIELGFLENAKDYAAKFYFAINKIDNVTTPELEDYLDYCRRLLQRTMDVESVVLMPVSAKHGHGIEVLKDRLAKDCNSAVKDILVESTILKLRDILDSARGRLDLYWNALKLPTAKLDEKFFSLKASLEEIKESSCRVADSVGSDETLSYSQLSNELDISLNEMKRKLTKEISELFGMEYHYELKGLSFEDKHKFDSSKDDKNKLKESFLKESKLVCDELEETLNLILLYKEKNTITVARKIDELNKLNRHIRSLKASLSA